MSLIAVLKYYNDAESREDYLALAYCGNPPVDAEGNLDPENENDLPEQFQLATLLETPPASEKVQ